MPIIWQVKGTWARPQSMLKILVLVKILESILRRRMKHPKKGRSLKENRKINPMRDHRHLHYQRSQTPSGKLCHLQEENNFLQKKKKQILLSEDQEVKKNMLTTWQLSHSWTRQLSMLRQLAPRKKILSIDTLLPELIDPLKRNSLKEENLRQINQEPWDQLDLSLIFKISHKFNQDMEENSKNLSLLNLDTTQVYLKTGKVR